MWQNTAIPCTVESWSYEMCSICEPDSTYSCGHFILFGTRISIVHSLKDFGLCVPAFCASARSLSRFSACACINRSCLITFNCGISSTLLPKLFVSFWSKLVGISPGITVMDFGLSVLECLVFLFLIFLKSVVFLQQMPSILFSF